MNRVGYDGRGTLGWLTSGIVYVLLLLLLLLLLFSRSDVFAA